MNAMHTPTSITRRTAIQSAAVLTLGTAAGAAQAEPVTITTAILVFLGKVVVGALGLGTALVSLAAMTERNKYQARSSLSTDPHDAVGPPIELKKEHRDQVYQGPDGTKLICKDGQLRVVPSDGSTPGQHSDLSLGELAACIDLAPIPGGPRQVPDPSSDRTKRSLDALKGIAEEPFKSLRYERQMRNTKGGRFLLVSAIPRNRKAEVLVLFDLNGPKARPVQKKESPLWALQGAKDFA